MAEIHETLNANIASAMLEIGRRLETIQKQYLEARRNEKQLLDELDKIKSERLALEEFVIEEMRKNAIKSTKLASGESIILTEQRRFSCKQDLREEMIDWFLASNMKNVLTVNANTLSAYFRDAGERGEDLPEFIEPHTRHALQVRGLRAKRAPK